MEEQSQQVQEPPRTIGASATKLYSTQSDADVESNGMNRSIENQTSHGDGNYSDVDDVHIQDNHNRRAKTNSVEQIQPGAHSDQKASRRLQNHSQINQNQRPNNIIAETHNSREAGSVYRANSSNDSVTSEQSWVTDPTSDERRANGWEGPHHPLQHVSWFALALFVAHYFFFLFPYLESLGRSVTIFIYCASAFTLLVSAFHATGTDAKDPALIFIPGMDPHQSPNEREEGKAYCHYCERFVYPTSKHCRITNKCVDDFDHHCVWLNNTIGRANYRSFVVLLLSAFVLLGTHIATCLLVIAEWIIDSGKYADRVDDVYGNGWENAIGVLAAVVGLLSLVAFLLVLQLLLFHSYLMYQGLTTFEYVNDHNALSQGYAPRYMVGTAKERRQRRREIRERGSREAKVRERIAERVKSRIRKGENPFAAATVELNRASRGSSGRGNSGTSQDDIGRVPSEAISRNTGEVFVGEGGLYNACDAGVDNETVTSPSKTVPRKSSCERDHEDDVEIKRTSEESDSEGEANGSRIQQEANCDLQNHGLEETKPTPGDSGNMQNIVGANGGSDNRPHPLAPYHSSDGENRS